MKKYAHLREKARLLRQQGATLTVICEQLALSKSTVYYWIRGLPIARTERQREQRCGAARAKHKAHALQRHQWYEEAYSKATETLENPLLRDFVVLYTAEGTKRDRNLVSICNSNASIMRVAHEHILSLSHNPHIIYQLQCHIDNDEEKLKGYWAGILGVTAANIRVTRKSNSGALSGRKWRSEYGVLEVRVWDTRLRCWIQAWMDFLYREWLQVELRGVA